MPEYKPTPEELNELKGAFEFLSSFKDKFTFWTIELDDYPKEGLLELPEREGECDVSPEIEEKYIEHNLLVLEHVKNLARRHTLFIYREDVFDFEEEKKSLDGKLNTATNPLSILKKEKKWVKEQVARYEAYEINDLKDLSNLDINNIKEIQWRMTLPRFWLDGYNDYYFWNKYPDLTYGKYEPSSLLSWNNGFEMAQYHEYIDKKLLSVSKNQTPIAQEETSVKRQLLLLHYTGYLTELSKNTRTDEERNKLLSIILNKHKQNIKKVLTYINHPADLFDIKTKENLTFVLDSLNKAGLEKEAREVQKELDALK